MKCMRLLRPDWEIAAIHQDIATYFAPMRVNFIVIIEKYPAAMK